MIEQTAPPLISFETWVSYPARTVNADDGLRVEFSVPVHMDLQPHISDPARTDILCKYRVRAGFKWGQLGRQASIKVTGYVETGPRGGQYFRCKSVEIIQGQRINNSDAATKRMVANMAKKAGVELPKKVKKQKTRRGKKMPSVPSQPSLFD